ncbi:LytR/AlgR family response regulator transcription factor [Chryseobacterium indoltheticum]|uniref:LytR/AlgR family response regulator transcription factor n=1 Tax=Chryseobacterium indoltheticum TaxID=254 RepID=UPI0019125EA2|nr:LytTR family DNA-binding domain-containing protein [Chryseobacterium indoltheticum]QQQ29108.1 response regulator transcription factor [Chryseobacterium indoltheticum]
MNCIIIDDEPLAREELHSMLQEISGPAVIGSFSNTLAAEKFLTENEADMVFLDIEMPKMTGLEFVEKIPKNSLVIFTTAYPQYALESYELDAIDYLLKPFNNERLKKAVDKAQHYSDLLSANKENSLEKSTLEFLIIRSDKKFYKVNFADIRYIEGLKDYVLIHTTSQKIIASMNLKTIHQKIPLPGFIRVSKSYIVNSDHIISFDSFSINLDDVEVPIGEIYKENFLKTFTNGLL